MSQTTGYDFAMARGQAGQLADSRENTVLSFAAEGALDFGAPVQRGTDPEKQVVIANDTGFLGIALFEHNHENVLAGTGTNYDDEDAVSVCISGAVVVESSVDTVVAGEVAYVTATGEYTNADGAGANLEIGEFETGGDTGDLVVVRI